MTFSPNDVVYIRGYKGLFLVTANNSSSGNYPLKANGMSFTIDGRYHIDGTQSLLTFVGVSQ